MGGNCPSISYAIPVSDKPEDSTPTFRHPNFKNGLHDSPKPHLKTMKIVVQESFKKYGNSNCLGNLKINIRKDCKAKRGKRIYLIQNLSTSFQWSSHHRQCHDSRKAIPPTWRRKAQIHRYFLPQPTLVDYCRCCLSALWLYHHSYLWYSRWWKYIICVQSYQFDHMLCEWSRC